MFGNEKAAKVLPDKVIPVAAVGLGMRPAPWVDNGINTRLLSRVQVTEFVSIILIKNELPTREPAPPPPPEPLRHPKDWID